MEIYTRRIKKIDEENEGGINSEEITSLFEDEYHDYDLTCKLSSASRKQVDKIINLTKLNSKFLDVKILKVVD